jgi:hypothetical protein
MMASTWVSQASPGEMGTARLGSVVFHLNNPLERRNGCRRLLYA